jgi:hypothetical protein
MSSQLKSGPATDEVKIKITAVQCNADFLHQEQNQPERLRIIWKQARQVNVVKEIKLQS